MESRIHIIGTTNQSKSRDLQLNMIFLLSLSVNNKQIKKMSGVINRNSKKSPPNSKAAHAAGKERARKLMELAIKEEMRRDEEEAKALEEENKILIEGKARFLEHLNNIGKNCESSDVRNKVIPPLMMFLGEFRGFTAEILNDEINQITSSFEESLQSKVKDLIITRLELANTPCN